MTERKSFVVPDDLAGQRADLITSRLTGLSRAGVRELVDAGAVKVAGAVTAASNRLAAGVVVEVEIPDVGTVPIANDDVPFALLLEDPDVLAIDKPSGVVVHPGAGHHDDTLLNGLVHAHPEILELGSERRFGIVHRLDKGTSGVLLVARTAHSYDVLRDQLRRRDVERTYLALSTGTFPADVGTVDAPIGRDPRHPTRMAVVRDGRPARTHYRVLASWEGTTLLEVTLETGRTHQIRVHLASIGGPLVGDAAYGQHRSPADPGRVWLHALRLRFTHPGTGEKDVVESPLPDDLRASLDGLGAPDRGSVPG